MASMATPSGIRAGAAYIELFVKDKIQTGLATAERRLRSFAASVNNMGRTLVATGIAAGMPLAFATKIFADFEQAMSAVRAVTEGTAEDFEKLKRKARELGKSTTFSAVQVAKGMEQLSKAGFSIDQMLQGTEAVLVLARAGNIELDYAAEVAANLGNAFGLSGDEIMRVADTLAVAANASSVNIDHMAETFKYLAPWAVQADQSIEDMSAAIAALGNVGIRASTAGTDLALVFKRIADPKVRKDLERTLNIKVTKGGKMLPFLEMVDRIAVASRKLSQIERMNLFSNVFDRAAKSMLSLTADSDNLDTVKKKMEDINGAAKRMAQVMDDNLWGAWNRLKNALSEVSIIIGESLQESFKKALEKMTAWVNQLQKWFDKTPGLAKAWGQLVAGLLTLGGALILLSLFIKLITFALMPLRKIFALVGLIAAKLLFLIAPFFSFKGVVAIALAAIAYFVLKLSGATDEIKNTWKNMAEALKNDWSASWSAIVDAVKAGELELAWEILTATLEVEWTRCLNALKKTWIGFENIITKWWDNLGKFISGGLTAWGASAIEFLLPAEEWVSRNIFGEDEYELRKRMAEMWQLAADMRMEVVRVDEELNKSAQENFEKGAAEVKKLDDALRAKEKKLDELRGKAHLAAAAAAGRAEDEAYRRNLEKKAKDAGEEIAANLGTPGGAIGTFSSPAAWRIRGPAKNTDEKILDTAREQLKKTDEMIRTMEQLDLVFTA